MDDLKTTANEASKEVVESAKLAALAVEKARLAQVELNEDKVRNIMKEVLHDVFDQNVSSGRFIDINRIPLICQSILGINQTLTDLKDNQKWAVRIVLGIVIAGVVGLLFK